MKTHAPLAPISEPLIERHGPAEASVEAPATMQEEPVPVPEELGSPVAAPEPSAEPLAAAEASPGSDAESLASDGSSPDAAVIQASREPVIAQRTVADPGVMPLIMPQVLRRSPLSSLLPCGSQKHRESRWKKAEAGLRGLGPTAAGATASGRTISRAPAPAGTIREAAAAARTIRGAAATVCAGCPARFSRAPSLGGRWAEFHYLRGVERERGSGSLFSPCSPQRSYRRGGF